VVVCVCDVERAVTSERDATRPPPHEPGRRTLAVIVALGAPRKGRDGTPRCDLANAMVVCVCDVERAVGKIAIDIERKRCIGKPN
jgi:hypothetical protein